MNSSSLARWLLLAAGLVSAGARAGPCDAYYTFDGNLSDTGGNGYHGQMIGADGATATPQYDKTNLGAALHVTGDSAMRAYMDLHFETCPKITLTAWIRLASNDVKATQYLVSTGSGSGPGIRASGVTVVLEGTGNGLMQQDAIRDKNTWFFIAGTWDWQAGVYRLYWRNRTVDGTLAEHRYTPEDALWIGAFNDSLSHPAQDLYIDDLRIYGRLLDPTEINAIRAAGTDHVAIAFTPTEQAPSAAATAASAGATAVGLADPQPAGATATPTAVIEPAGPPCSAPGECPTGSYCAFDGTCHPDRHAPMRSFELQEAYVPAAETLIVSEDAYSERPPEEPPDSGLTPQGPTGGAGDKTVRESLAEMDFGGSPSGDVRDCTSFAEVASDLFTSARDAIVDVAAAVGCTLLTQPVHVTNAAAGLADLAGYETDEFRHKLLQETYYKCIEEANAVGQLPDKAVAFWNSATGKSTWATIGPRRLKISNDGNIIAPGDRKFISDMPIWNSDTGRFILDELDGRAEITGRICTIDMNQRYTRIVKFTMNDTPTERQNTPQTEIWDLSGLEGKLLIVYLDGSGIPGQNFQYNLRFEGLDLPPP